MATLKQLTPPFDAAHLRDGHTAHNGFAGFLPDGWTLLNPDSFCGAPNPFYPSPPIDPFARLVTTLIAHPVRGIAAGENGTTAADSNLFWTYDKLTGLHVDAQAGFLATQTGNGGFSLDVLPDGSWVLHFDGSNDTIGHNGHDTAPPPVPPQPAGNTVVYDTSNGAAVYNGAAGDITYDGRGAPDAPVAGNDTISGGAGDYMIGGSTPHFIGPTGNVGNCAIYTDSAGPVLADMQNSQGYGGTAEGNLYDDINQVRGSLFSNVLIGATTGTDLKSGGDNSLLVSTGGDGFELRPDGSGNVLVSTTGADRVLFDPTHGWQLGDQNVLLGFDPTHGVYLDLTDLGSNFHSPTAAGYNPATGTGDINDYVRIIDQSDGDHVLFNAGGNVQTAGVELIDLKLDHGLTAGALYASHNIVI